MQSKAHRSGRAAAGLSYEGILRGNGRDCLQPMKEPKAALIDRMADVEMMCSV